jgi:hypothetical protein
VPDGRIPRPGALEETQAVYDVSRFACQLRLPHVVYTTLNHTEMARYAEEERGVNEAERKNQVTWTYRLLGSKIEVTTKFPWRAPVDVRIETFQYGTEAAAKQAAKLNGWKLES